MTHERQDINFPGGWPAKGEVWADGRRRFTSVQDAIDFADSHVVVGPGTYDEGGITISGKPNGFTLHGSGYGTHIAESGTANNGIFSELTDYARIQNLRASSDNSGVRIASGYGVQINNVTVNAGTENYGINTYAPETVVSNCRVEGSAFDGIRFRGANGQCVNNYADSCGRDGIKLQGAPRSVVSSNVSENNTADGINVYSTGQSIAIIGNHCYNNDTNIKTETDFNLIVGNIMNGGITANSSTAGLNTKKTANLEH